MTSTSINQANQAEITNSVAAIPGGQVDGQENGNSPQVQEGQSQAGREAENRGKPESELRAAARRHGLNLKELASLMGVNYGYLSSVASGRRP